MAKTLKDKGEERKKLSERINELIKEKSSIGYEGTPPFAVEQVVEFPGINWRFMTATQLRKAVKLLEEL